MADALLTLVTAMLAETAGKDGEEEEKEERCNSPGHCGSRGSSNVDRFQSDREHQNSNTV